VDIESTRQTRIKFETGIEPVSNLAIHPRRKRTGHSGNLSKSILIIYVLLFEGAKPYTEAMENQTTLEADARPLNRRGRPVMEENEKKRPMTARLSPEAHNLIGALVRDMGLSQAAVIETAVRDLAKARKLR
jgi:hypothetical protein